MTPCPTCRAEATNPLVCTACGGLLSGDRAPTPFEVFGLVPALELDAAALKRRLLELSRRMHPDYFATADAATRELAERNTAELNLAYEVLADEPARADWLVKSLGGPDENQERKMPEAFLIEVLEWNEALEEARAADVGSSARAALANLARELGTRRDEALARLRAELEPTPERNSPRLVEARRQLNALRYVDRTLEEIRALEVGRPAART
ncbi:MAG: Fe-S protein assembly co-chaperone HscB [Planctomycetes bacterium]|nr:Fe-S protein assembly co-chaperone HscB [Planctomycetota bacterium]